MGNDILEWKRKNFGIRIKNMNSQIADEEDVIVVDEKISALEENETTINPDIDI